MKTAKAQIAAFWADCAYCGEPLSNKEGSLLLQCEDYHFHTSKVIKCWKCLKLNKIPQQILKGQNGYSRKNQENNKTCNHRFPLLPAGKKKAAPIR